MDKEVISVEMLGVDPRTFHMRSERSTTELHPRENTFMWSMEDYQLKFIV